MHDMILISLINFILEGKQKKEEVEMHDKKKCLRRKDLKILRRSWIFNQIIEQMKLTQKKTLYKKKKKTRSRLGVEEWTTVLVEELITIHVHYCIECVDYARYVSQKRKDQTYHELRLHIKFDNLHNYYKL